MKKVLSILLAVLFISLSIPLAAGAANIVDSGTCGEGLTWTLDSDETLTISGTGEISGIPTHLRTHVKKLVINNGVTAIGAQEFFYFYELTSVTIPGTVKTIGYEAFDSCLSLKSITIPEGVTTICDAAFEDCHRLANINLPDSLTSIGEGAFNYTAFRENEDNWENGALYLGKYLISADPTSGDYTVKDGTRLIADGAFWSSNVKNVIIPDSVTTIGREAFWSCEWLESVFIPYSVTNIGEDIFIFCEDPAINAYTGSYAQQYAQENNISFIPYERVVRLAGTSRIDTAIKIADEGWDHSEVVILTNGYSFADALAGAPLAFNFDAPILLTANNAELEESVHNMIDEFQPYKVIILGGVGAVNENIEHTLEADYEVERVFGTTRFDTAVAIAEKLAEINGEYSDSAFVAYGYNYPDALAVSSAAAISSTPILFAKADGSFTESTAAYISDNNVQNVTILGGTSAVGADAEDNLAALGASNVERIFGTTRYDTAFAIIQKYADLYTGENIFFATGASFPDALAGGAFASRSCAPIILVHPTAVPDGVLEYIAAKDPKFVYVLGGTGAVANSTVAKFISLIG
ncbi:MAG: cell wall-binding repeat-containing protein [Clostridia bacterium]|nr:cell wall-binding repeat-containing protein [Clostridia bacterium]